MTMTLNGSGTIAGLSAGGLPDASIVQADLATGVAGTGPAFSAYLSGSSQSITTNTWTKVALNTEDFDTNNAFDSTTNYRFQPTVAGYYLLNGLVYQNATGMGESITGVYKNGSLYKSFSDVSVTNVASYRLIGGSCLVYLNGSTDYAELYTLIVGTSPAVFTGSDSTYFQGSMVRAA